MMEFSTDAGLNNPTEHLWDQLRCDNARVINTATRVDLQQLLVEEWDTIPQLHVVRLVTSTRRLWLCMDLTEVPDLVNCVKGQKLRTRENTYWGTLSFFRGAHVLLISQKYNPYQFRLAVEATNQAFQQCIIQH